MARFDRTVLPLFNNSGGVQQSSTIINNQSLLTIKPYRSNFEPRKISLKFSDGNNGWKIDRQTLDVLISQLLYISQDMKDREEQDGEGSVVPRQTLSTLAGYHHDNYGPSRVDDESEVEDFS